MKKLRILKENEIARTFCCRIVEEDTRTDFFVVFIDTFRGTPQGYNEDS